MGAAITLQNIFAEVAIFDRIVVFVDDWSHVANCNGATDVANISDLDNYSVDPSPMMRNLQFQTYLYRDSPSQFNEWALHLQF